MLKYWWVSLWWRLLGFNRPMPIYLKWTLLNNTSLVFFCCFFFLFFFFFFFLFVLICLCVCEGSSFQNIGTYIYIYTCTVCREYTYKTTFPYLLISFFRFKLIKHKRFRDVNLKKKYAVCKHEEFSMYTYLLSSSYEVSNGKLKLLTWYFRQFFNC